MRTKTTTTHPLLPPFFLPRRCQCKGDPPPGVSILGSATQRNKGGGGLRTKTTTTPPMLPPFRPPRRCQCKGGPPPGVSSLGSATRREVGGDSLRTKTTTTPPMLLPFQPPPRCQCEGDAPPGVSSLGSAHLMRRCPATSLSLFLGSFDKSIKGCVTKCLVGTVFSIAPAFSMSSAFNKVVKHLSQHQCLHCQEI